ncbi:MAG: GTPase HflX [Pseudomonadota bacterium]
MHKTSPEKLNALLLTIQLNMEGNKSYSYERIAAEMEGLAYTLGFNKKAALFIKLGKVNSATFIGKGKIEQIKNIVLENDIDVILLNHDISPSQHKNLEKYIDRKVMEWSEIILDIFAGRAKTKAAKTQVEIARLLYALPRLTRAWTHLERQRGGIGLRGIGEQQLELDRRMIRKRLKNLNDQLKIIRMGQQTRASSRKDVFRVSIVGYTNAGKSTLLKALTGCDTLIEDRLFATLDSKIRSLKVKERPRVLVSDTVGFIRNLPHSLIESFHTTLEEVSDSDLLLHVIDVNDEDYENQFKETLKVLKEINSASKPIIYVLNKSDLLSQKHFIESLKKKHHPACEISALKARGIDELKDMIFNQYLGTLDSYKIKIDLKNAWISNKVRSITTIIEEIYDDKHLVIKFKAPKVQALSMIKNFQDQGFLLNSKD